MFFFLLWLIDVLVFLMLGVVLRARLCVCVCVCSVFTSGTHPHSGRAGCIEACPSSLAHRAPRQRGSFFEFCFGVKGVTGVRGLGGRACGARVGVGNGCVCKGSECCYVSA